jgi:hypothetical protein
MLAAAPPGGTTSQPQKGACELNSTAPVGPSWRRLAVGPIPPAGRGTRSTRSHLGKRPEHEIPDFCSRWGGWARRCAPFWARSRRKGLGTKGAWVRVGSWRGSDRQRAPAGAVGARRSAVCELRRQKVAPKAGTESGVEMTGGDATVARNTAATSQKSFDTN